MKTVVVNSSDTFEYRINLLVDVLIKNKHQVRVVTSDFMHIEKKKRKEEKENYYYIKTIPYQKNISFQRLWSHYNFSIEAYKLIKAWDFDLLYLVVPPNSQAGIAKKYSNSNVKIIMDIIDMWPESMPFRFTDIFPFNLWADIRNRSLKYADFVITECDLYQEKLKKYLDKCKTKTIYWAHKDNEILFNPKLNNEKINLCYLGSINNIIDIPLIGKLIEIIKEQKPVVLKIIGDGEKRDLLIKSAKEAGAEVIFYGKIFDTQIKQDIFDTCHFGLNIMKATVCVGLSMKSIDYFEAGLPIINNLSGDTENLVRTYEIGINLSDLAEYKNIISLVDESMREKTRKVYKEKFSYECYFNEINKIIYNLKL